MFARYILCFKLENLILYSVYSIIKGDWIQCFSQSDCSCGQEISNNDFDNTVWELNENIVDGINELIKKKKLYNGQV